MKVVYPIQDNLSLCTNINEIYGILDKYYDRMQTPPGSIHLPRKIYTNFISSWSGNTLNPLPMSKLPYLLHLTTIYGIIPVFCDYSSQAAEIMIDLSPEFDKEFEKIILGRKDP